MFQFVIMDISVGIVPRLVGSVRTRPHVITLKGFVPKAVLLTTMANSVCYVSGVVFH